MLSLPSIASATAAVTVPAVRTATTRATSDARCTVALGNACAIQCIDEAAWHGETRIECEKSWQLDRLLAINLLKCTG
jgi:hypothetical protein